MRRWLCVSVLLAGVLLGLAGAYLGWVMVRINRQALVEEARPADAIVILGAAAYRGRPSPTLKARLDHGLDLYRRGLAPWIVTTGGAGGDPDFTEGEVGRDYLVRRGVPPEAIVVEKEGSSTAYSTSAVAEIMHRMNLTSCIVVSDGYHIFRAKKMLQAHGLTAYGSPRPAPVRNDWRHWWRCFRQAAGYLLWQLGITI